METVSKGIVQYDEFTFYVNLRRNKKLICIGTFSSLLGAIIARDSFIKENPKVNQGQHMKDRNKYNWSILADFRETCLTDIRYCERCGKDLSESTRYEWCVHHKDRDRKNNCIENYELLCKSCHQEEHCVRDANGRFTQSSTTIRKEYIQVDGSGQNSNEL